MNVCSVNIMFLFTVEHYHGSCQKNNTVHMLESSRNLKWLKFIVKKILPIS